jgi:hypothetical protein
VSAGAEPASAVGAELRPEMIKYNVNVETANGRTQAGTERHGDTHGPGCWQVYWLARA